MWRGLTKKLPVLLHYIWRWRRWRQMHACQGCFVQAASHAESMQYLKTPDGCHRLHVENSVYLSQKNPLTA